MTTIGVLVRHDIDPQRIVDVTVALGPQEVQVTYIDQEGQLVSGRVAMSAAALLAVLDAEAA